MSVLEKLNVGLVGAAGRGGSFRTAFEINGARIHAVCDTRADALEQARKAIGASEQYTDYEEMLEKSELDAVVIGTPQNLHAPQAVKALEHDLHVLSEVPAAVSVDQSKELVQACLRSRGTYMMAENYTYMRPNVLVRELARQGLFGEVYYAEGEYLHDVTDLAERTTWRRHWQVGIDGITYPTHSLGPIMQWMPGDRVTRVSCEGSGHHYRDPRGEEYHQDTSVMLCKTARGALIKIRLDLVSARPHAMTNYQLQGTTGAYESSRGGGERGKLWLRQLSEEVRWQDFTSLMEDKEWAGQYLPELWRNPPPELLKAGHGGGDYFEVLDFINAVRGVAPCPIGIHEAMDMTLPGLISQQSVTRAGAWMDVPDTRRWEKGLPQPQLVMEWPEGRPVPNAPLPAGYELRQYTEADEAAYIELMDKAGFTGWTPEQVRGMIRQVLPDGFFLVVHRPTGRLVATTVSIHRPTDRYPYGGELGWVAGDPEHKGKGLGMVVCAVATARLHQAGYRRIYLLTDDFRLPALKTYLKLGYRPVFSHESMEERWRRIHETLGWSSQ